MSQIVGFSYWVQPNPGTSPLPETAFVYNSVEASDVLVCRNHVSRERCTVFTSQMTLRIRINSSLQGSDSWQASGFICFLPELKHTQTRHPEECRVWRTALPVWQHMFLLHAGKFHAYDGGQRKSTGQTGFPLRSNEMTLSLCTTCCTASIQCDTEMAPLTRGESSDATLCSKTCSHGKIRFFTV